MSVVAPPEPPRQEEPEALIPQARARQRRRVLLIAAGLVAAVGIGLAVWASLRGGGSLAAGQSGHRAGTVDHSRAALRGRRGIGEVGSGGGMTWAISGRGFWLTANGGLTWHPALLPRSSGGVTGSRADPIANIRDVQFVGRLHGWVSTVRRARYLRDGRRRTHLGRVDSARLPKHLRGRSTRLPRRTQRLRALLRPERLRQALPNRRRGAYLAARLAAARVGEIAFVDRGTGFALGGQPNIVTGLYRGSAFGQLDVTTDGGRTWSPYHVGPSHRFSEEPVALGRDVVVVQNGPNPADGWNLAPGTVYMSRDGGSDWSARPVPSGLGLPTSFDAASPSIWAWPSGRALFTTHDAGRHWLRIGLRGLSRAVEIGDIDFTSRRVGWAVMSGFASHDLLFHTRDGGLHWTPAGPRVRKDRKRG